MERRKIKTLMCEHDIRQKELGDMLGISEVAVSRIVTGRKKHVSPVIRVKIAHILKSEVCILFEGEGEYGQIDGRG